MLGGVHLVVVVEVSILRWWLLWLLVVGLLFDK